MLYEVITPIESTDKNTQAVFGDYIDVYDIQQAVEDGATVRIFYENRLANVITSYSIHYTKLYDFTALHELGHLLLDIDNEVFSQKEIEKFCHRFAGAMLLPKETLFNELGEKRSSISINELIFIKESYGISIQAIIRITSYNVCYTKLLRFIIYFSDSIRH